MHSENSNRAKGNCKGFTLIELIIVIAIMATLTGLLVPQFFKYIEKTRLDADNAVIDEIVQAMKTQGIDGEVAANPDDVFYGYQIAICSLVRYPGEEEFHLWLKPYEDYDYIGEFVAYYTNLHGGDNNFTRDDVIRYATNSYRVAELTSHVKLISDTYKNNIQWQGSGNNSYQEILITSVYYNGAVMVNVDNYISEVGGVPQRHLFN